MRTKIFAVLASLSMSVFGLEIEMPFALPEAGIVESFVNSNINGSRGLSLLHKDRPHEWQQVGGHLMWLPVPYKGPAFYELPFYRAADREMDQAILDTLATNLTMSTALYAKACYGDKWKDQILRAAQARARFYYEHPYTVSSDFYYNPANLPVKQTGAKRTHSRKVAMPKRGISANIRVYGSLVSYDTNAATTVCYPFSTSNGQGTFLIRPQDKARCVTNDTLLLSYCMPCFGVALHRPQDYSHEFGHYFNWAIASESTEVIFSDITWAEFLPAFHGLKVHAFSQGFDLGVDGEFKKYASSITLSAVQPILPRDAYRLLTYYLSANTSAGMQKLRALCEDANIGMQVL